MLLAILLDACTAPPPPGAGPAQDPVTTCPAGQALDGGTCVPEACGVGTWGNLPVDGSTVYVDLAAAAGGDGSDAAPLTSMQEGVDLAGELGGGLVAVAAGSYVETIAFGDAHKGVTLAGRCRELVTIDGREGDALPAVEVHGDRKRPAVAIEGVTVTGGTYIGLKVQRATVVVTRTDVRENMVVGVVTGDADLTLDDVRVYDAVPDRRGDYGLGVDVEDAASLSAAGCTIQGNTLVGVIAGSDGAVVALTDTAILDTASSPDGTGGDGIVVQGGASLTAERCTVQGNAGVGVFAEGTRTRVELSDTAVLDTLPSPDGDGGGGITVQDDASLSATGCTVERNAESGVFASGAKTTVELTDTTILDTSPGADRAGGRGLEAADGATVTATGCTLQGNTEFGLLASNPGTVVDLAETSILDTRQGAAGMDGGGIEVADGAAVTATDCTLEGNTGFGVGATDTGSTVDLAYVEILDTEPSPDGSMGRGITVQSAAFLSAIGSTVQGNAQIGVFATNEGTMVNLTDTAILDTVPSRDGTEGRGIQATDGATLQATGCAIGGNSEFGIGASGTGTAIEIDHSEVTGTQRGRATGFALAVVAQVGARIRAADCTISDNEGPGLYAVSSGELDVARSVLSGNSFAGSVAIDASLAVTSTSITDTVPDAEWGGGFGVYATDAFGPPTVTVLDSAIGPHELAAIWLDGPGTYDIERNTLSGSAGFAQGSATLHGNAVFAENGVTAWNGTTGLLVSENTISGSADIGVFLDGSSAILSGNSWYSNGTDVRQQLCDNITELTGGDLLGVPRALVCPGTNVLTAYDLTFTSLYLRVAETEE